MARASIAFHIGRLSLLTSSHGPGSCYFCDMPSSIPSTLPCAPRATATPGQDTKRGRCEGRARGSSKIHPLEALPYIDRLQTRGGVRSITDRLRRHALSPRKHPPRVLDSPSPARSPTATAAACATSSDFSAHSITQGGDGRAPPGARAYTGSSSSLSPNRSWCAKLHADPWSNRAKAWCGRQSAPLPIRCAVRCVRSCHAQRVCARFDVEQQW